MTFDLQGWMSRHLVAAGGRGGLDAYRQREGDRPVCVWGGGSKGTKDVSTESFYEITITKFL